MLVSRFFMISSCSAYIDISSQHRSIDLHWVNAAASSCATPVASCQLPLSPFRPSMFLATITSPALSARPKTILRLGTSISMFSGAYMLMSLALTLLHRLVRLGHLVSCISGESYISNHFDAF